MKSSDFSRPSLAEERPILTGVVYVCGAGGKTSFIKREARRAAGAGLSVVILTTTRMLREEETITDAEEALRAIAPGRIVMAGKPWKRAASELAEKVTAFSEEEMERLKEKADLALIEADGARHCLLKVPYPHEPVIGPDADRIFILYSPDAIGKRPRDVCYNPEGVEAILREALPAATAHEKEVSGYGRSDRQQFAATAPVRETAADESLSGKGDQVCRPDRREAVPLKEDLILTEAAIRTVLERGYESPLKERYPKAQVEVVQGPETRFHLILLAAGLSTRFGSNKLLYEIDGKPMYRHMADRLLSLTAEDPAHMDLLVVTSYEEIRREMEAAGAMVAINPDPARGISSSIHCALRALEEGSGICGNDFLLFFNGDQPGLRLETIRRFIRELKESGRRLGAVWDGAAMRSPCAFGAEYLPTLLRISGDRGGKGILRKEADRVFLFYVENAEELEDIDSL